MTAVKLSLWASALLLLAASALAEDSLYDGESVHAEIASHLFCAKPAPLCA
jgi:hypothetical protein